MKVILEGFKTLAEGANRFGEWGCMGINKLMGETVPFFIGGCMINGLEPGPEVVGLMT